MIERKFGRIVNITSASVKIADRRPGFVERRPRRPHRLRRRRRAPGRAAQRHHQQLLPGSFDTDRLRGTLAPRWPSSQRLASRRPPRRARQHPARRFGDPAEFGATSAFLCSAHAGFITGQNLLIDGGVFNGGVLEKRFTPLVPAKAGTQGCVWPILGLRNEISRWSPTRAGEAGPECANEWNLGQRTFDMFLRQTKKRPASPPAFKSRARGSVGYLVINAVFAGAAGPPPQRYFTPTERISTCEETSPI